MVDLDDTVDEVKQQIRDAEDPDYSELLEQEKEGKDRKTIKEFLEKRIENEEEAEEEVEEELVEEIEEETEGGILSGFTPPQILAGGAMAGLILGLIIGALALPADTGISKPQAENRVSTLLTASGQISEEDITISSERRHSMFYMNITAETEGVNGTTRTQSQSYYMTNDGQLVFPETIRSPFGGAQQVAINVDDAIQQAQRPAPEPPATETQAPSDNTTQ
jgi:hypothetical protein